MNLKYHKVYALLLLLFVVLWSCQEDEEVVNPVVNPNAALSPEELLRDTTYLIMQEWYLWNDEMPEINPADYASAPDLMKALQYHPLDKWSYITEEKEYDDFFTRGEYKGYGYGPAFDDEDNLRVSLVYRDSPFGRAGVERGWIISKINGQAINPSTYSNQLIEAATNTFEFITPEGKTVTETLAKSTIAINTVLHHEVINVNGQPVGYLAFNSFIDNSIEELRPAFEAFQQADITDLILDLRYNGGGKVYVAEYIAGNIIGSRGTDRNFLQYAYNNDIQQLIDADPETKASLTTKFQTPEFPLDLDRLVMITSGRTASASELLINGLRPFMDVLIVGENTHGKPVGSRPFRSGGYAINPISFKVINDDGEGEYFGGFPVDAFVADDLSRPFGDPEEARLNEALNFVETGSFRVAGARTTPAPAEKSTIELEGFQREIGAL